jgi:hypothetical protein
MRRFLAACLLILGCGDVAGPGEAEGVFELRRLNDQELPYDHDGLGCCTYLAGKMTLASDGKYTMELTARNRNTGVVFTATEWGQFTHEQGAMAFAFAGYSVAGLLCDVGALSGDSLTVYFGGEGHGSPDQFRALLVRRR